MLSKFSTTIIVLLAMVALLAPATVATISTNVATIREIRETGSISIIAMDPASAQILTFNVTCTLVGTQQTYQPYSWGILGFPLVLFENLPYGDYEVVIAAPRYYTMKEVITVSAEQSAPYIYTFLAPVGDGVSFARHWTATSFFLGFVIRLPNGYIRADEYNDPNVLDGRFSSDEMIFSNTVPTSVIEHNYLKTRLANPIAGTYPIRMDTYDLQGIEAFGLFNYTLVNTKVSIYTGPNEDNGLYKTIASQSIEARSWYIGDLVVEADGQYCKNYRWVEKNAYSWQYNQPATGVDKGIIYSDCPDTSPEALACSTIVYTSSVDTLTCGEFGDPHIVKFDGSGVTCGFDARMILVDNPYYTVWSDNILINGTVAATGFKSITLQYKRCNPISITWTTDNLNPDWRNAPKAGLHYIRQVGNNVYLDVIHTRIQVREVNGYLVVGISTPSELAIGGVCASGCPDKEIDVSAIAKRDANALAGVTMMMDINKAHDACSSAGLDGFELDACTFDLVTSGDDGFVDQAVQSKTVRTSVATPWEPSLPPSAASSIAPTIMLLVAMLAVLFV